MNEKKLQSIKTAHQDNSLIMPNGETVSMNSRETRLNNNILVIGGSGAGKTRSCVTPNLLAHTGSYIIADTKGNLYKKYSDGFRRDGYRVIHVNFIHPEFSDCYDPFAYIQSSNDIQKLAHMIVYCTDKKSGGRGGSYDPFWDKSGELLLSALIGYVVENKTLGETGCFNDISSLIAEIDPRKWEESEKCKVDFRFEALKKRYRTITGKESWAYRQFRKFCVFSPKTISTIMLTLQSSIAFFDTQEVQRMLQQDEINFRSIGQRRTVVFVEISDTDRSKDLLANLFYSQAMNQLCSFADEECADNRLPIPVRFILDDFGTNCRIDGFENMISNIRSRDISVMIMLQSCSQLAAAYDDSEHTIIDNCDTLFYLGGNDPDTARFVSQRCNKPVHRILSMPIGMNWIIRRGENPKFTKTVDISEYDTSKLRRYSRNEYTDSKNGLV